MSNELKLLSKVELGALSLKNRMVMAPLTRMRAVEGDVCNPLAKLYYAQRAGAGLIITEATQVSPLGKGYPATPGIYSEAQTKAWAEVVDAVHEKGGKIVAQLWHVGRISHSTLHPEEGLPIAPSAIAPSGKLMDANWKGVPYETPREMTTEDIAKVINQFKVAAANAKTAGFDGVEIHGANGYLLDQFLQDATNKRTDQFGGDFAGRARLLIEIIKAVSSVYPLGQIGVRLSPFGTFNEVSDSDTKGLFTYVLNELNQFNLGYVHLIEPRATTAGGNDATNTEAPLTSEMFRTAYKGNLISAGGYTKESGEAALNANLADAIAYGRLYISNPDLEKRFERGSALNPYDRSTFYGGSDKGYTDYPSL